jgi:hypothetical protein
MRSFSRLKRRVAVGTALAVVAAVSRQRHSVGQPQADDVDWFVNLPAGLGDRDR